VGELHRRITRPRSLSDAIRSAGNKGRIPVIADIKPFSPRDGDLLKKRKPADLSRLLAAAGVCAVSVVTESKNFGGNLQMLREVAQAGAVPVLQKDFFSTPGQVTAAYEAGADAFLLILATTPDEIAREIYQYGRKLGLEAVVEIHSRNELVRALRLTPGIIGIINRNILELEKDDGHVGVTEELAPLVPDGIITISESSLRSRQEVLRAVRAGADAVLIGTALLQAPDMHSFVADLTVL
jgi:indole-3-glycerol phosphate synthase